MDCNRSRTGRSSPRLRYSVRFNAAQWQIIRTNGKGRDWTSGWVCFAFGHPSHYADIDVSARSGCRQSPQIKPVGGIHVADDDTNCGARRFLYQIYPPGENQRRINNWGCAHAPCRSCWEVDCGDTGPCKNFHPQRRNVGFFHNGIWLLRISTACLGALVATGLPIGLHQNWDNRLAWNWNILRTTQFAHARTYSLR